MGAVPIMRAAREARCQGATTVMGLVMARMSGMSSRNSSSGPA